MRSRKASRAVGQHHGDVRAALMRAALAMLEQGEDDVISLRELARRIGVSPAAPYHHFADKETLLGAVAEEGFRQLDAALAEVAAVARTPRTRLSRMAARYVSFALEHRAHYRVMVGAKLLELGPDSLRAAAMASFMRLARAIGDVASEDERVIRRRAAMGWALAHGVVMLSMDGALAPLGVGDPESLAKLVGDEVARMADPGPDRG